MDLLVDIGNSTTVVAAYDGREIFDVQTWPTSEFPASFRRLDRKLVSRIIVSSVVPDIDAQLSGVDNIHFLTRDTIPLAGVNVTDVSQVGSDRLVNALAAYQHVQSSCLVVDSGTAVTFCYVDADGVYQGGAIFPGMGISSKALNDYTAKIPHIVVSERTSLFGKTTTEAVQNGLYFGFIAMVNGVLDHYRTIDPSVRVIGTGAGLEVIRSQCQLDEYRPKLILEGLALCANSF